MRGGTYVRCLALGLLQTLIGWSYVCVHSAQVEGCPAAAPGDSQDIAIVIDSIELQEDVALTPEMRARLLDELKSKSFHASSAADTDWQGKVGQEIRTPLQDQGYFTVLVDVVSGLIRAEPHRLHYWVSVRTESGLQYRLGEVRFENALGFTDRALRPEIPLQKGELFDVSSVREGLKRIARLYNRRGYIDATIEAQFAIDSEAHQVDMTFMLDPGVQYRIGAVQVRGWSAAAEKLLRSKFEFGQVFDGTALGEFFAENKTLLPRGATAENGVTITRDVQNGTVGIVFEHRVCALP
jgi:outer membrane translocation and assembly module TamA